MHRMADLFEAMVQKLKGALDRGGWHGRYGHAEVLYLPPQAHCLIALHPMTRQEIAWAKSAGVRNVHDWKAIRLRMRFSDGLCELELPGAEVYEFWPCDMDAVLGKVIVCGVERQRQSISQEAVDMFVESIVKNDAGQTDVQGLMQELCAKIQGSEAWV